ncbi:MAG: hypothetical protein AMJ53_03765 [Gammaproteobacteria bacterium SG8_11]|nr:MAG: hypothetical protein AMJ53_03765 [Gammaproteobacteria bacterium SG8_11]
MTYSKIRTALFILIILLTAACEPATHEKTQQSVVKIPLLSLIQANSIDIQRLIAYVIIDDTDRYDMDIQEDGSGVATVPNMTIGKSYNIKLVFEYRLSDTEIVELVTLSEDVIIGPEKTVELQKGNYQYTDSDGDDATNLDEIDFGTLYNDQSSMPIISLMITPSQITLTNGTTQTLTLAGSYSDGSQVTDFSGLNWSNSNNTVAGFDSSTMTVSATSAGSAQLTASVHGVSSTTTINVTEAVLDSISLSAATIDIALGNSATVNATGHYSDGSSVDITTQVTWSIADDSIAAINSFGQITTLVQGSTFVNAQLGTKYASATLTVGAPVLELLTITPQSQSVPLGSTYTVRVDGTYSDDSAATLTDQVSWSTSNPNISVSTSGIVSASAEGVYTLTASMDGVTADAQATITPKEILSISLSPGNPSASLGERVNFTATAIYTDDSQADVTNAVNWSSSATSIAIVDNNPGSKGLTKNIIAGVTTISATHVDSGISGNTQYTALGDKVVNRAYLLSSAGDLVVVDAIDDTILTTVTLDDTGVGGIALYPAQPLYAFIAHSATDTVSRLDLTTHTVTNTISVGNGPGTVLSYTDSFNNTPDKIYVVNINSGGGNGTLSIINPSNNTVINTLTLGEFPSDAAIKINSQGRVFIVNEASPSNGRPGSVMSLDTATDILTTLTGIGDCPREVAYRTITYRMIVGNDCSTGASTTYSAEFINISSVTGAVAEGPISLPANGSISALAVNPAGLHMYVWHRSGLINIFEYVNNTIVDNISRPSWGIAIEYNYRQNKLYIGTNCLQSPAAVDVYDDSYNFLKSISVPSCIGYHGMAFTP